MERPTSIGSYLTTFTKELGNRILKSLPPLHGAQDPPSPLLGKLLRRPYPGQVIAIGGIVKRLGGLSVRTALAAQFGDHTLRDVGAHPSPWVGLAQRADEQFSADLSGRSPWWSCPGEKIDRLFVVMPQSRQTIKFDELSRLRWLYRLALGQPHQQDFIETVMQMPNDGRQEYVLSLSAWSYLTVADRTS